MKKLQQAFCCSLVFASLFTLSTQAQDVDPGDLLEESIDRVAKQDGYHLKLDEEISMEKLSFNIKGKGIVNRKEHRAFGTAEIPQLKYTTSAYVIENKLAYRTGRGKNQSEWKQRTGTGSYIRKFKPEFYAGLLVASGKDFNMKQTRKMYIISSNIDQNVSNIMTRFLPEKNMVKKYLSILDLKQGKATVYIRKKDKLISKVHIRLAMQTGFQGLNPKTRDEDSNESNESEKTEENGKEEEQELPRTNISLGITMSFSDYNKDLSFEIPEEAQKLLSPETDEKKEEKESSPDVW